MTPEIEKLREYLDDFEWIVDAIELELVDDPDWAEPSDTSYLNEKDRANPDIMANVEAMAATNALIAWFGRDAEGFVGLWRGPKNTPLERAPVVRLDTEGQYEIEGATVADYLLLAVGDDEEEEAQGLLEELGLKPSKSRKAAQKAIDKLGASQVNDHRNTLYEQARAKRGLPPVTAG
jgi:hypothetical protein